MGIQRPGDRHTVTVLKMNDQAFGTPADGKTFTVENEFTTVSGHAPGRATETHSEPQS